MKKPSVDKNNKRVKKKVNKSQEKIAIKRFHPDIISMKEEELMVSTIYNYYVPKKHFPDLKGNEDYFAFCVN